VVDATRPQQHVWRGTLDALARGEVVANRDGAGTIVVGEVVALAVQKEREAAGLAVGGPYVGRG
jgi:siroheme synthase